MYCFSESIQGMMETLLDSGICEKFDNVEACMQNLPPFWDALAKAMFDAETGWFSSQYLCHVSEKIPCGQKYIGGGSKTIDIP